MKKPRIILVLLGTDHHRFDRLVEWADTWARSHSHDRVIVQFGQSQAPSDAEGEWFYEPAELRTLAREAWAVVTHAGPGNIADARTGGHVPLVLPRDPALAEIVDDHQQRFSRWAQERNLVYAIDSTDQLDKKLEELPDRGTRVAETGQRSSDATTARLERLAAAGPGVYLPHSVDATTVVYVGGSGRCGSTLLERLVAELPGVVSLGEVRHLWERGIRDDELCGCGRSFSRCPFWRSVGERAFGGWQTVDVERVLELRARVDRQRHLLKSAARHTSPSLRRDLIAYSEYYRRIYDAARDLTGAQVVVDSSKAAPTACALSHNRHVDLRIWHITRDSRGVAFSWAKEVARPETADGRLMPNLSATSSTLLWLSLNLTIQALRYRRVPVARMRYEDLVEDPAGVVSTVWRQLRLPGSGQLPMVGPRSLELRPTHSVAGNPMRFRTGVTELRADTEWQARMPARDRRLVTAMSYPVLRWLGYPRDAS